MTGGTSFLGAHIVKQLSADGHELTLLARQPDSSPWLKELPQAKVIQGDLLDLSSWKHLLQGHDALIHNGLIWDEDPTELEMADVRASALLFEAAAKDGIDQIIYTSSAAVHRPWKSVMSEKVLLQPETTYGATKAATEAFLSALSHQLVFRFTIVRPGAVVGGPAYPGASFKCDARLSAMARQAKSSEPIALQPRDARQFVGASDLARVYKAVLDKGCSNQTFITVDLRHTLWLEIAEQLVKLTGSRSLINCEGPDAFAWRLDVSLLETELGITLDSRGDMAQALAHLAQASHS